MSTIDQQFVEFIVKSLVGKPDAVKIERRIDEKGVLLELTVDPEDLGRVIGKRGATAQSIRSLLRALGTKNDARYNLKIVDNGVGGYSRRPEPTTAPADDVSNIRDNDASDDVRDDAVVTEDTRDAEDNEKSEDTDDIDAELEEVRSAKSDESVVSKTRKELEELDDLDV